MTVSAQDFLIEEDNQSKGQCECCGHDTFTLTGFVSDQTKSLAAYFITYTNGKSEHGAEFTFILGRWDEEATANDRYIVVLHHFPERGFMLDSDFADKKSSMLELASNMLNRDDIVGSEFADSLFSMVDAVYMKDTRLDEIRNWKTDA